MFDRNLGAVLLELHHNAQCGAPEMAFAAGSGGQHKDGVADATFIPDGHVVTVGGGKAIVWTSEGRPASDRPIGMPEGATAMLVRALYCDAARAVIVGDKLGKVRLLDFLNGEVETDVIADRADTIVHFALGPSLVGGRAVQGTLAIVSQSALDSEIKFHTWIALPESEKGMFSGERPNPLRVETAPIRAVALHPNAPVMAIASNAVQPKLFDYEHNEALPLGRSTDTLGWHDGATSAVAFSATGRYLAVGSDDGRISIWETRANALSSGGEGAVRNRRASDKL